MPQKIKITILSKSVQPGHRSVHNSEDEKKKSFTILQKPLSKKTALLTAEVCHQFAIPEQPKTKT